MSAPASASSFTTLALPMAAAKCSALRVQAQQRSGSRCRDALVTVPVCARVRVASAVVARCSRLPPHAHPRVSPAPVFVHDLAQDLPAVLEHLRERVNVTLCACGCVYMRWCVCGTMRGEVNT
jgi:hypothetical protein